MSHPGLSPLARGTLKPELHYQKGQRFIPAGAGNTLASDSTLTACPVYPRWRGEHQQRYNIEGLTCGLSPLARGTPVPCVSLLAGLRFIPAGAGNTRD